MTQSKISNRFRTFLFVEIGGIFIPLIYHAVYGLVITAEARPNNLAYPYPRNWFYTIQRVTGIILFFFILSTC
jgi:succinate dehydrogenase / fumarate reductase cytochrome b subunit